MGLEVTGLQLGPSGGTVTGEALEAAPSGLEPVAGAAPPCGSGRGAAWVMAGG